MKRCIALLISICFILIFINTAFAIEIPKGNESIYPKLTIIFQIEKNNDFWIIYCLDTSQNIWSFYDEEEVWHIGDIVNLLLLHNTQLQEDQVIAAYAEEYNNLKFFLQIIQWCKYCTTFPITRFRC